MQAAPRLLALDTATERLCVAVVRDGRVWSAEEAGGARSSARLLPLVEELMAQAGLAMADLQAVAIGRGPGAFTGLRTACSVGQGLALGLGIPVLMLDSLLLVAREAAPHLVPADAVRFTVLVAMDARMGEAYAAAYTAGPALEADGSGRRWTEAIAPALWTPAAWQSAVDALVAQEPAGSIAACGNAWVALPELRLPASLALRADTVDRAGALARQAVHAWHDGAAVDPSEALPVYLRDRVALTTAEREAQRREARA